MKQEEIKKTVKARYAHRARENSQCCTSSCCGVGYSVEELESIPKEAILGLGCGNPVALSDLKMGETILDLGSGAGIDIFLAANLVGPEGKAIGVDMTEEMVGKAKGLAQKYGYKNVEFRLGEIESLPLADKSVDVIISNCVINLSPDKSKVFQEAYRVLKPGGRFIVSDIVAERTLPEGVRRNLNAWAACVAGALAQHEYLGKLKEAGFGNIEVLSNNRTFYVEDPGTKSLERMLSITVRGHKP